MSRNFSTSWVFAVATGNTGSHISGNENAHIYFNILRVHCSRLKNVRSRCCDKTYALPGYSASRLKSRKQREVLVMRDDKTKMRRDRNFPSRRWEEKKIEKWHRNVMKSFIFHFFRLAICSDYNFRNGIIQAKTTVILWIQNTHKIS